MNPPYPDHDCPACDRGEKTTTPPVSSTVGSMPVHSPSGQVCQKYIDPELLKILVDSNQSKGVSSPAPQPIYYDFISDPYDKAFAALYNMVIFALQQNKAGQIAWTCPTILEAEHRLIQRSVLLKHKERCDGWVHKINSNQEGTENWFSHERCQVCNPEEDEGEDTDLEAKFRSLVALLRDLATPIQHYFPISGLTSYNLKMRVDGALKDFEKIYPEGTE